MMDGGTHDTLPKLNYEASRDLYDKILEIGKKWVSAPYNVDGWRSGCGGRSWAQQRI